MTLVGVNIEEDTWICPQCESLNHGIYWSHSVKCWNCEKYELPALAEHKKKVYDEAVHNLMAEEEKKRLKERIRLIRGEIYSLESEISDLEFECQKLEGELKGWK